MTSPTAPHSPLVRKVIAVLAVLVGANALLWLVGPWLPEPVTFPTREIQLAVQTLEERVGDGCVDVLVTGNSVAAEALSAQRIAEDLGLDSGAVSVLPGSIGTVDVDWMERITLPRARPGTVVYVASPLMFVPEDLASHYGLNLYTRAVVTRGGWGGDLHRWAIDHLPLAEYRLSLTEIEGLVNAARGDLPETYADVVEAAGWVLEPDGHIASSGSWSGGSPFLQRLRAEAEVVEGRWRIDEAQEEALRDEFVRLDEEGRRVVMVIPPVTADLRSAYPGGEQGFEEYLAAARRLGDGTGLVTVDLSEEPYADELFRDTHHLNAEGSRRLTGEVVDRLGTADLVACTEVG